MYRVAVFYVCIVASVALAGSGSIVSSFRTPCTNGVYGIDYHGGYLYHADGGVGWIYKTTTIGSVLSSINNLTRATGIDRTQVEFWTCNYGATIYRLSTTGSIISYFTAPGSRMGYGVTKGEGVLWYSNGYYIYKLTSGGSLVSSFEPPATGAAGVCWDAPYLWLAGYSTSKIYQVNQNGSVVETFGISQKPRGITWDGEYVWYAAVNWVYKLRVCFTGVTPTSWGKMKALYR